MPKAKVKILVQKNGEPGFGHIITGKVFVGYNVPQNFLPDADFDLLATQITEEKDREAFKQNWEFKKATVRY